MPEILPLECSLSTDPYYSPVETAKRWRDPKVMDQIELDANDEPTGWIRVHCGMWDDVTSLADWQADQILGKEKP